MLRADFMILFEPLFSNNLIYEQDSASVGF